MTKRIGILDKRWNNDRDGEEESGCGGSHFKESKILRIVQNANLSFCSCVFTFVFSRLMEIENSLGFSVEKTYYTNPPPFFVGVAL